MSEMTVQNNNTGRAVSEYSSFIGDDFATKKAVFGAISNAAPIAEHLGTVIALTDIIVQATEIEDDVTGEMVTVPRVIFVDKDGNAFAAISNGLVNSVRTLLQVLGQPSTWDEPLDIVVTEKKAKKGKTFVVELP